MGSEQSHHASGGGDQPRGAPPRSGSTDFPPMSPTFRSSGDGGTISPCGTNQESVCSDSEVPYVSYTVNRPISDSPKKKPSFYKLRLASAASAATSSLTSGKRSVSMDVNFGHNTSATSKGKLRSKHDTLVVVNRGSGSGDGRFQEEDPELRRLSEIPSFLPIIRCSTNTTGAMTKDPDILEALDHRGLATLAQRYQHHLRFVAGVVSTEQAEICRKVRDVDEKISATAAQMVERQRDLNKHAEKIKSVAEMNKILNRCHLLLNENIEQIEVLNDMLPVEDRLEPFVWTTG